MDTLLLTNKNSMRAQDTRYDGKFWLLTAAIINFIIFFSSCKSVIPKNYKIYISPIVNKTNWAQVDSELTEYLHSFFNKIAFMENKKESADVQIDISINNIQIFTQISRNFDVPVLSEISLYASAKFVGKKTNYNVELYEESQYIPGQKEMIDYALRRLYEKISTRIYFEIVKIIKSDKKI